MIAPLLALALAATAPSTPSPAQASAASRAAARPEPRFTEADAAPLFDKGAGLRASAALEAGKWEDAARLFAAIPGPEARYLRAIALVQARRGEEALPALAGLEKRLPEISDRVVFWRARAREATGTDDAAAAAGYAEVPVGSLLRTDAQLARGRILARLGAREQALATLGPLTSAPPAEIGHADAAAEALLLAGRLHAAGEAPGEALEARAAFIGCWASHPVAGFADACLGALERLPGEAGAAPGPDDRLRRAEALLDANRVDLALSELSALVPALPEAAPGEALACRARFAFGRALKRTRQHTRALEVLRPVAERCEDATLRMRALYALAGSASIVSPEEGIALYRDLVREYPESALADDALLYAGDGLARAGKSDEARAALEELVDRYPKGDYRADALFRLAWLARGTGDRAAALGWLDKLEKDYRGDPYERARAVYWRARILDERAGPGDADAARALWIGLAEAVPPDWYGLLARARLEERMPGSAPPWASPGRAPPPGLDAPVGALGFDRHFAAGVRLLRMGLGRAAADELGAVERKGVGPDGVLLLAELLDRSGDHKTSHNLVRALARTLLEARPEGVALRAWRVAYPLAFRDDVERWARPAGVPPELLLALMREESGLDPGVVSAAGAVGLTQLMLPTAQGVARKLGLGSLGPAALTQPPVAIRIGATYFGGLLKRYGGSEAVALAAYNVGETAVRNWLRARGDLPLDAFVEEIPVQETRGYVKRVLRSYATYRWLYGAKGPVLLSQAVPTLK